MQRRAMMVLLIVGMATAMAQAQPSTFQTAPTFTVCGTGQDVTKLIATADVGSPPAGAPDGLLDVITAAQNQQACVLYGRADGTFVAGPNTDLGRIPTALAVADVTGDHIPDLLIGDTSDTLTVFRGFNDGRPFQQLGNPISAGKVPLAIVVVGAGGGGGTIDLNHDGTPDLAILNQEGTPNGGLTFLIGDGHGGFAPPAPPARAVISAGVDSEAVVTGDFNHDNNADFAVANAFSDDVSIILGSNNGDFTLAQTISVRQPPATSAEPLAIAARDMNGDTLLDLVVTVRALDAVAVLDGRADGTFAAPRFYASGAPGSSPMGLALADLNLNGAVDAVIPNDLSGDISVLLGDGHGGFARPRAFVADEQPLAVVTGLANGDTIPDVLAVNRGRSMPNIAVMLGLGDGSLASVEDVTTDSGPNAVAAGDVDNDGQTDLIVAHDTGSIFVSLADPAGGFRAPQILQAPADVIALAVGDLDRNGLLDIVAASNTMSNSMAQVSVFLGRRGGGFAAPVNVAIGSGASGVTLGDWNRDGNLDVAVIRTNFGTNGSVAILLGSATGTLGAPTSFDVEVTPVSIDSGDFNNDGRLDLVVSNNGSGSVSILLGNGNGTFQTGRFVSVGGNPKAVAVADFDRDGAQDLAVAIAMSNAVTVLYGDGHGTFLEGARVFADTSPAALAARDVSGDLIPDLLIADEVANDVVVWIKNPSDRQFQLSPSDRIAVSRRPISIATGDFDGDGRYDAAAANNFVHSASVLTNVRPASVLRGDGNGDRRLSAADAVAIAREISDGDGTRVEDVGRPGGYAANPGADANGDGLITAQDALALAHRLFARL